MGINETNLVDKIIVEDKLGYKSKENSTTWQKAALTSSSRKTQQSDRKQYQALQELLAVSLPACCSHSHSSISVLATTLEDGVTFLEGFTATRCCTLYRTTARLSRWVKSDVMLMYIRKSGAQCNNFCLRMQLHRFPCINSRVQWVHFQLSAVRLWRSLSSCCGGGWSKPVKTLHPVHLSTCELQACST